MAFSPAPCRMFSRPINLSQQHRSLAETRKQHDRYRWRPRLGSWPGRCVHQHRIIEARGPTEWQPRRRGLSIMKIHGRSKSLLILKSGRTWEGCEDQWKLIQPWASWKNMYFSAYHRLRNGIHERTKEYCVAHGVHPLRFGSDFGGPSRTMGLTPLNALPPKQTHSSTRRLVLLDSWRRNFEQQAAVLGTEDLGNH